MIRDLSEGEFAVGNQQRPGLLCIHAAGVEGFLPAGLHHGAAQFVPVGQIDGDDRALVVAAHQQIRDTGVFQHFSDKQQILDHGLVGGQACVHQGQAALDLNDVGPVFHPLDDGQRSGLEVFALMLGFGGAEVDIVFCCYICNRNLQ